MSNVNAKKYARALSGCDTNELQEISEILCGYSALFADKKIKERILSPLITADEKESILLSEQITNKHVVNLIKLLIEKDSLTLLPAISEEVRLSLAVKTKQYSGKIHSNEPLSNDALSEITTKVSTKVDAAVAFEFIQSDIDGFKIEIPDLNLELSFSHSTMKTQLINHILKAI